MWKSARVGVYQLLNEGYIICYLWTAVKFLQDLKIEEMIRETKDMTIGRE
jgi:hypothetical protein